MGCMAGVCAGRSDAGKCLTAAAPEGRRMRVQGAMMNIAAALMGATPDNAAAAAMTELVVSDLAATEFASAMARLVRMGIIAALQAVAVFADCDTWTARIATRVEINGAGVVVAGAFIRRLSINVRAPDARNIAIRRERSGGPDNPAPCKRQGRSPSKSLRRKSRRKCYRAARTPPGLATPRSFQIPRHVRRVQQPVDLGRVFQCVVRLKRQIRCEPQP